MDSCRRDYGFTGRGSDRYFIHDTSLFESEKQQPMGKIKIMIASALCLAVPIWGVEAATPEIHPVVSNPAALHSQPEDWQDLELSDLRFSESPAPTSLVNADLIDGLFSYESMTPEELENALQDDLLLPEGNHFWTRTKLAIGLTLLLAVGLLAGIIALFSGSGSGSGSGSDSGTGESGEDSDQNRNQLPPPIFGWGGGDGGPLALLDASEGSGAGGGAVGGSGFGGTIEEIAGGSEIPPLIPHHPEPSTMLLLSLGLLLPILRKRIL